MSKFEQAKKKECAYLTRLISVLYKILGRYRQEIYHKLILAQETH